MGAGIAKAELQNAHAGNVEALAKRMHVGGDEAEIFGNEGQIAQPGAQNLEELVLRAVDPAAVNGRRLAGGDFPGLLETTEVIEPHDVAGARAQPTRCTHQS